MILNFHLTKIIVIFVRELIHLFLNELTIGCYLIPTLAYVALYCKDPLNIAIVPLSMTTAFSDGLVDCGASSQFLYT